MHVQGAIAHDARIRAADNEHQQVFVVWGHIELERHDRALLSALNATRIRELVTALIKPKGKLLTEEIRIPSRSFAGSINSPLAAKVCTDDNIKNAVVKAVTRGYALIGLTKKR